MALEDHSKITRNHIISDFASEYPNQSTPFPTISHAAVLESSPFTFDRLFDKKNHLKVRVCIFALSVDQRFVMIKWYFSDISLILRKVSNIATRLVQFAWKFPSRVWDDAIGVRASQQAWICPPFMVYDWFPWYAPFSLQRLHDIIFHDIFLAAPARAWTSARVKTPPVFSCRDYIWLWNRGNAKDRFTPKRGSGYFYLWPRKRGKPICGRIEIFAMDVFSLLGARPRVK